MDIHTRFNIDDTVYFVQGMKGGTRLKDGGIRREKHREAWIVIGPCRVAGILIDEAGAHCEMEIPAAVNEECLYCNRTARPNICNIHLERQVFASAAEAGQFVDQQ